MTKNPYFGKIESVEVLIFWEISAGEEGLDVMISRIFHLDSEKNEVYRRIAKTMKGVLKVIPYKRKGVELTPLAEIYILEKQHLEDKELVQQFYKFFRIFS